MNNNLTWLKPSGEWGIDGVDLTTLPPKVYGALCKLLELEHPYGGAQQEPDQPLTLEELREMDGEPMWLIGEGLAYYDIFCGETTDHIAQFYKDALPTWSYGRTWRAYRRKPEEGTKERHPICAVTGVPCSRCKPGPCESRRMTVQ